MSSLGHILDELVAIENSLPKNPSFNNETCVKLEQRYQHYLSKLRHHYPQISIDSLDILISYHFEKRAEIKKLLSQIEISEKRYDELVKRHSDLKRNIEQALKTQ